VKKTLKVEILRVDVTSGEAERMVDFVAEEKPLHIFLNKTHYVTLFSSPSNLKELVLGFLLSEHIVGSIGDIDKISLEETVCKVKLKPEIDLKQRPSFSRPFSRVVLSTCGSQLPRQFSGRLPKVKSRLVVKAETILDCVSRLNSLAETYRRTGGVHAAAICRFDGCFLAFAEDVGRHNAVDKVIGTAALGKADFGECFLALSGRMSSEIVLKAARVGLPIVASLAAAIDSGVKIAEKAGLTLVGFVRGKRMNVYSFPERIAR
jgi:FdhD protein